MDYSKMSLSEMVQRIEHLKDRSQTSLNQRKTLEIGYACFPCALGIFFTFGLIPSAILVGVGFLLINLNKSSDYFEYENCNREILQIKEEVKFRSEMM